MPAAVPDSQLATLPARVAGALIDIGAMLLGFTASAVLWAATLGPSGDALTAGLIIFAASLQAGYPVVFETVTGGRSLGKIAMGLRVVADDGGPERFPQALIRALVAMLEIWALVGIPALVCSLLAPHRKRLGDLLAGTVVISVRRKPPVTTPATAPPVPSMPPTLAWWASTLQLSALRPQTLQAAQRFLSAAPQLPWHARQIAAYRVSGEMLAQISPPPPPETPPELILAAVLAESYRREQARVQAGRFSPPFR